MKVKEAIEILQFYANTGMGESELCIPNNKKSIGALSSTKVESIHAGFDWDSNSMFIYPEVEMINIEQKKP